MSDNDIKKSPPFTDSCEEEGDSAANYRLFVARAFEPQTMPHAFTAAIIILWSITIVVCAIVVHTYFMSVTR